MYLSYTGKSPTDMYLLYMGKALRYMYLCYTHCTITFYTHTHIVVVYEYHMRMTAKAVNTWNLYAIVYNAADSYNCTQSCKSQLYEVRFYTRSYKTQSCNNHWLWPTLQLLHT